MKEVLKVRIADSTFALEREAHALLAEWLNAHQKECGAERIAELEQSVATQILERQAANIVVDKALVQSIIDTLGTPEGYTPSSHTTTTPPPTHPPTTKDIPSVGPLGRVIIIGGKIILGLFLAGWLLTAIGLLVGFVSLVAIGDVWTEYLALPLEGISPVVFAGLICAVVVLFMGIVADLGFSLLRCKRINLKRLVVGGVIWLIFLLWLVFAGVRNINNWVVWAHESEAKIEQWDREFDEWEERFEEQLESTLFNPTTLLIDGTDTHLTFYLNDLGDSLKLEKLCEEFDELYRYDDTILNHLIKGDEVVVDVAMSQKNNTITRNTTITTPAGVTTINVSVDKCSGNCLDYKINQ